MVFAYKRSDTYCITSRNLVRKLSVHTTATSAAIR
jgi:hypothetical protein